jgi:DNA modification methylase
VVDNSGRTLLEKTDKAVPHYLTKVIRSAFTEFEKRCQINVKGIASENFMQNSPEIQFGDAQNLPLENDSIDLIVTSPPYASNAIDYMRAHKFSLIWFGYKINDLGTKRRDYIGNEAITNFSFEDLPEYSQLIVNRINIKDSKKSLALLRYYSEMTRVLREMFRILKPRKSAIVVVGNSIIRGVDAEIPYCLSEIGKSIGFKVPAIGVRQLDRNKRMMPAGTRIDLSSTIQQRMHEEHVIGFYKE